MIFQRVCTYLKNEKKQNKQLLVKKNEESWFVEDAKMLFNEYRGGLKENIYISFM